MYVVQKYQEYKGVRKLIVISWKQYFLNKQQSVSVRIFI